MSSPRDLGQTWTWDVPVGSSPGYFVVHIDRDANHMGPSSASGGERDRVASAVSSGGDPRREFMKRSKVVPLERVRELRFSEKRGMLEVYHDAKKPLIVHRREGDVALEIYATLRARLAPEVEPIEGYLGTSGATRRAYEAFWTSVVIGGLIIFLSTDVESDPDHGGRKAAAKNLLDRVLGTLGVGGTVTIVSATTALCVAWIVYRKKNPHLAEVICVRR